MSISRVEERGGARKFERKEASIESTESEVLHVPADEVNRAHAPQRDFPSRHQAVFKMCVFY
jgi:hypothetical protein